MNEKVIKIYPNFELRRLDVHYRLDKLSVGWKCAHCGYSIPKDVEIHGVRRSPLKLYFICKVCEKKSEITSEGYTTFNYLVHYLKMDLEIGIH